MFQRGIKASAFSLYLCLCKDFKMAQSTVYLFVVVAIAVIVGSSGQDSRCPANSKYSECPQRKSCRPSCDKPSGTEICTFECDLANSCVCNPGYLLNSRGKCVRPSQCPNGAPVCPANKVWSNCAKLRSCRPSCSRPNGAEVCPEVCVADCVCKKGLVLNDKGECINKSKCPSKCPANSTHSDCPLRLSCRPSCDKPAGTGACTRECDVTNPCVCNPGYVLNNKRACIKQSQCPKRYG